MKKHLLLLLTLLCLGGSRAWADVTAYVVDGKTNGTAHNPIGTLTTKDGTTLSTTATSGLAGIVLTNIAVSDQGSWIDQRQLVIKPAAAQTAEKITITAPAGYVITGYSISCANWASTNPYKVDTSDEFSDATATSISTHTSYTVVSKSGLEASSTGFWIYQNADALQWLMINEFTISLKRTSVIYGVSNGTFYNSSGNAITSSFGQSWVSSGSPAVTFKNSAGHNITVSDGSFYPGGSGSTYTISTTPDYRITGYTLTATASSSVTQAQTLTPSAGGDAQSWNASEEKTLTVSGLNTPSTSFTMGGTHTALSVNSFVIQVEEATSVKALSELSNSKSYYVVGARGTWKFASADATSMTSGTDFEDVTSVNQQIAFIQSDKGNLYAYSVATGKFLATGNTLSDTPTPIYITSTGNDTYPWFVSLTSDKSADNINITSGSVAFIAYNALDEGNCWSISEAGDYTIPESATTAIAEFETTNVVVTYNLYYNEAVLASKSVQQAVGSAAASPWDAPAYCTLSDVSGTTVSDENNEINITLTSSLPFTLSSSYADATWYYLTLRGKYAMYGSSAPYSLTTTKATAVATAENALWAFVGNPLDGVRVINKGAGEGKYLDSGETTIQMGTIVDGYSLWTIGQNEYGFTLHCGDKYLNDVSNNGVLGSWDNAEYAYADNGSAMTVEAVDYYDLALAYIEQYATDNAVADDGYFGVTTITKGQYVAQIQTAFGNNHAGLTATLYETVVRPGCSSMIKYPETGYYRLKNVNEAGYYLGYDGTADGDGEVCLRGMQDATSAKTIIHFQKADNANTYQFSVEGTHIAGVSASQKRTPSETAADFQVEYISPGVASFSTTLSGYTYLHCSASQQYVIVGWETGKNSPASKWTIEKVDNLALTLNGPIDGKYYATLCLPFEVTIDGAEAYTLSLNDAKTGLTLSEALTTVPAGTPVLLRGESATATANIAANAPSGALNGETALTGTFTDLNVTADTDYFLGTDGTAVGFYKWQGTTLKANRAYLPASKLEANGEVKGFAIDFDVETAINEIANSKSVNGTFYNLAGQRVQQPARGLYIVDGKKVLIK